MPMTIEERDKYIQKRFAWLEKHPQPPNEKSYGSMESYWDDVVKWNKEHPDRPIPISSGVKKAFNL